MKLLEVANRMVASAINDRIEDINADNKPDKCKLCVADFDGSEYLLTCLNRTTMTVSLKLNYWSILEKDGDVVSFLTNLYKDTLAYKDEDPLFAVDDEEAAARYNISFSVDLLKLAKADTTMQEKTVNELARLKRNCFAAAFNVHFKAHKEKATVSRIVIPFRPEETMYIKANKDNVTVIFSTIFKDPDDQVLAKIFLNEFSTKVQGNKNNSPQVIYQKDPPKEIMDHNSALKGDNVYYLTFVLQPIHIQRGDNTIDLIHSFRTYLHYHIKCSKAFMHQRMRSKTDEFIQILNRAKPAEKKPIKERAGFSIFE